VRRSSATVVPWPPAQIASLSAHGMSSPPISEVVFTDPDTAQPGRF
jgi:hypothetical protein